MGSVRRNAPGPSKSITRCAIAAILGLASSGCASFGHYRDADYPFLGGFWDFGKPAPEPFIADHYAKQMNEGRAKAAAKQKAEDGADQGAKDSKKPADGAGAPSAKPEGAGDGDDGKPRLSSAKARSDQNAIRVTLGRPESLPLIAGIPRDPSNAQVASASKSRWKKESSGGGREAADEDARGVGDGGDLEIAGHDPGPAPERIEPIPLRQSEPPTVAQVPRESSGPRPIRNVPDLSSRPEAQEPADEEPPALAAVTKPRETSKRPAKMDDLLDRAMARLESLTSYQVSMSRVERVNGKLQPEEDVLLSVRRAPQAVRLQWQSGSSKGREVIYSTSLDDRMIHVNMANAAIPLPRMSIAVDSPLIVKNSRHSIKEAGFDTILANMCQGPKARDNRGSSGGDVVYKGVIKSNGVDRPCHCFVRQTPEGEKWEVLLDTESLLPRSVVAKDARGELLERYTYRDLKENPTELASADAFDPDARWGKPKGLFSRLAGAAASVGNGSSSPTTTR